MRRWIQSPSLRLLSVAAGTTTSVYRMRRWLGDGTISHQRKKHKRRLYCEHQDENFNIYHPEQMRKKKQQEPLDNDENNNTKDIFDELILLKENYLLHEYEEKLLAIYEQNLDYGEGRKDKACAAYELALFYCQSGNKKYTKRINTLLSQLGYQYKLGKGVWNYDSNQYASLNATKGIAYCYDNVLDDSLLTSLKDIFCSNSQFWSYHNYPTSKFFSYNVPIKCKKTKRNPQNIIQQLAQYLLPLVSQSFPELSLETQVTSIEWWAHNRPNGPATGHRVSLSFLIS